MSPRRSGWLPWILLALVAAVTLAVAATGGSAASSNEDRVDAIARTVKCPVCAGESVAESNAELSRTIRVDIARRVEAGETDDQIRAYYVSQYGDAVLLIPPSGGVAGLVWVLPVVVLALSLTALGATFARWRAEPARRPTDGDRDLVARALADRRDAHGEGTGA